MDNTAHSLMARIDEFTESVEQLWQSEEQQGGAANSAAAESSGSGEKQ